MYTRDRLVWQCVVPHCSARLWTTPAPHVYYIGVQGYHRCFNVTPIYSLMNFQSSVSNTYPYINPRFPVPSSKQVTLTSNIPTAPRYAESTTNSRGFHAITIDGVMYIKKVERKNWVTYRCHQYYNLKCSSVCNVASDMQILKEPGPHNHPTSSLLDANPKPQLSLQR